MKSIDLGNENVKSLLLKLSIPAIFAQVINALYNIVDRIYIGHIPQNGDMALTGLGLCFPIIIFISAFYSLTAQGGATIAAIYMGKKDNKTAENIMGNSVTLVIISSILLMILFQIIKEPVLYAVGASENTINYAMEYMSIYLIGTLPVIFTMGMNAYINTQGFSNIGMKTILIGAISNIILDPIFIFGFNMGVKGAATATIISQTISSIWVLKFLLGEKTILKIRKKYLKLEVGFVRDSFSIGISPFVMMSTESLISIVLNSTLYKTGGDIAVGSMTIISSMMQFITLPLQGLGQGAQPIISYNFGAKLFDRVKETYKTFRKSAVIFTAVAFVIIMIFASNISSIFTDSQPLIEFTAPYMRIYFFMIIAMGIQMSCQQTFLATGQAKISLFMACLRKLILLIPLTFIFSTIWGTTGVFISEPVSDFTAATVTFIMFKRKENITFGSK